MHEYKYLIIDFIGTLTYLFIHSIFKTPLVTGLLIAIILYFDGHANPVLTMSEMLRNKIEIKKGIHIIFVQLIAMLLATIVFYKIENRK